jgi:hypothetical protein
MVRGLVAGVVVFPLARFGAHWGFGDAVGVGVFWALMVFMIARMMP